MKILGHRGAAGSAPENTLMSFAKGLEYGVDGFEFDVQLSRDGEVVIIHDERVDRTSNGVGWVKDFTLKELKTLNFGLNFGLQAEIPTLAELLSMLQGKSYILNVEIKSGLIEYPGIAAKVVGSLEEFGVMSQTIISSFDHQVLLEVRQHYPQVQTGVLYECGPIEPWFYAAKLGAQHLHPHFAFVTPELVRECRLRGIGISTWTVDEPWAMERVTAAEVDIVITNHPERFKQLGRVN